MKTRASLAVRFLLKSIQFFTVFYFVNHDVDYGNKKIYHEMEIKKSIAWLMIIFLISTACFFLLLLYAITTTFMDSNESTFNINAIVEELSLQTQAVPMSRWVFDEVELKLGCPIDSDERVDVIKKFSGKMEIQPEVNIFFTRIAKGDLIIKLQSRLQNSVADLYDFNNDFLNTQPRHCMFIYIRNVSDRSKQGKTIVLPLTGHIKLGKLMQFSEFSDVPILREGEVSILDKTILFNHHYVVGPFPLSLGDYLIVDKAIEKTSNNEIITPGQGFILVDYNPAIRVIYREIGHKATIKRFQSEDYDISNNAWSRLTHDKFLSNAWVIVIIWFMLNKILIKYLSEYQYQSRIKNDKWRRGNHKKI